MVFGFCFLFFCSTLSAENTISVQYRPSLVYSSEWDLNNGGFIAKGQRAGLVKDKEDRNNWNAIIKLNKPIDITPYFGKKVYFFTETSGDKVVRLAPNFFLKKNNKRYFVWWDKKRTDPSIVQRKYISFPCDQNGFIIGSIEIPALDSKHFFYAIEENSFEPFIVEDKSEITKKDLASSLCTDWQHDIPGGYYLNAEQRVLGKYGTVIFKHFYVGNQKPVQLLNPDRDIWVKNISEAEKKILKQELDLPEQYATKELEDYQYVIGEKTILGIKQFYEENKDRFFTDPYFKRTNYIPWKNVAQNFRIINKGREVACHLDNGKIIVKNKLDRDEWTIIKLSEISEEDALKKLQGILRLSVELDVLGLEKGYHSWQTILIDVIQTDKEGREVGANDEVRLPIQTQVTVNNYCGVFENEFILNKNTKKLEIILKLAGCPDYDRHKKGISFDSLELKKLSLIKGSGVIDYKKILSTIPDNVRQIINRNGEQYIHMPQGQGEAIFFGERFYSINRESSSGTTVEYDIKSGATYGGIYTNLIDVTEIEELELAAEWIGLLEKHGNPPNWASNAIEIAYYDQNGNIVYAADYGSDRYPNIRLDPNIKQVQIHKDFFVVPHARGAKYAQIKMHIVRLFDVKKNSYDDENFFTGKSLMSKIIFRPSLKIKNVANFAPYNGSFYKHRSGRALNWSVDGVKVEEDLNTEVRRIIFENVDKTWGSLKTDFVVPEEAIALRGKLNIDIQKMQTGLEQYQGFGLFLEADVVDDKGNTFHYMGIPVFQKVEDRLIRFDRIPVPYKGNIEYFIPLYHEKLKIHKLVWQLALAGKGKVFLYPIDKTSDSIIDIEFLTSEDIPNNPAFWSQYSLTETGPNSFSFQKHYRLNIDNRDYYYDCAESLNDHLTGYLHKEMFITDELKKLKVNQEKTFGKAKVHALPSYARVDTEYILPDDPYIYVYFKLEGDEQTSRFNFKPVLLDKDGNVLEIPSLFRNGNTWEYNPHNKDVFDLKEKTYEIVVPINKQDFEANRVRLTFGGNQGEVKFYDLKISSLRKITHKETLTADNIKDKYTFSIDKSTLSKVFIQQAVDEIPFARLDKIEKEFLDGSEMQFLSDYSPIITPLSVWYDSSLRKRDQEIRDSIQKGKVSYKKGSWYCKDDKEFQQVGFTIVGENFNKWYDIRRKEFKTKERYNPYWARYLTNEERKELKKIMKFNDYIKMFIKSQAKLWKRMGINTIRVHQIFSNWSNLDPAELRLTVSLLKVLQKEERFLIIFDLLPNPDFASKFFTRTFKRKLHAKDFADNTDLFKAVIVLPDVYDEYVKPAIRNILEMFYLYDFWPNSLSFLNETGLVHGFWTIDKNNNQANPYFSKLYHYYYERYLKLLPSYPKTNEFIEKAYPLIQVNIESIKLKKLLADLETISSMLKDKKRVKDNSAYVYYNLLWDGEVRKYGTYFQELKAVKEAIRPLIVNPATLSYYDNIPNVMVTIDSKIKKLKKVIENKQVENMGNLEAILDDQYLDIELLLLKAAIFEEKMPADYKIPKDIALTYIDTFDNLNKQQRLQAFFTSFLLQVSAAREVKSYIDDKTTDKNYTMGLNNDYIRDAFSLLANAYLFSHSNDYELRFNKYTHHPVGGHSLQVHSGHGNVFDDDSNIDLNFNLFNLLLPLGYSARLSETNYTYAGDDRSGQGNWTVLDYLKMIAKGHHILFFHMGLNNVDKPLIDDYFNGGNRPFKVNAMAILGAVAMAKQLDPDFIKVSDFKYDRFNQKITLSAPKISAIAGTFLGNKALSTQTGDFAFTYKGKRDVVDMTIIKLQLEKDIYIDFYGIERNWQQQNRPNNPNLIKYFGVPPVLYQTPQGVLKMKLPEDGYEDMNLVGFTPSKEKIQIPREAYYIEDGFLILDTTQVEAVVSSYKIHCIN